MQKIKKLVDSMSVGEGLKVLSGIPRSEFRQNKHKTKREVWIVANIIHKLGYSVDYLLNTNIPQADSTDVEIVDIVNNAKFRFQVAEIAPKDEKVQEVFLGTTSHGYGELKNQTYELIQRLVQQKEAKYQSLDMANLNLAIYFNSPIAFIDRELDLDVEELESYFQYSKFGSIVIFTGANAVFIKNNGLVAVG